MSQQINDNFQLLAALPIDDRNMKPTIAERDAISPTRRFQGLQCFVQQTQTLYQLTGGILNTNWVGIAGLNISNGLETVIEGFYALSAGKETLLDWEVGDKFRGWIGSRYVVGEILSLPVSLPGDIDNTSKVDLAIDSDALNDIGSNSIAVAYVETNGVNATAQIGNLRKPFLTIDAALDALPATGGVIRIGVGTFNSPNKVKIKDNVAFIGSKKPKANNVVTITGTNTQPTSTAPTKLINGTILNGTFDYTLHDNITIKDLGVDVGSDWCTAFNAGAAADGLVTSQFYNMAGGLPSQDGIHQLQVNSRPREGIYVSNVIALGKSPTSLGHAMLFENIQNSHIENVSTYYMNNGLVIKGMRVTLNGLDAHSHDYNGLVVKANDYAFSEDVTVSNVVINSLSGHEGDGFRVVSENGILAKRISFSNISCSYVKTGFQNNGPADAINMNGITIFDTTQKGIILDNFVFNANLNNISVSNTTQNGIELNSTSGQVKSISNSQVYGLGSNAYVLTTSGTGIINISNSAALNSANSYVISGNNVFGDANFASGAMTGQFNKNAVNTTGLVVKTGASNSIGAGSIVMFHNNVVGAGERQYLFQMNASNGLDVWRFDGTTYSNTGIKLNTSGTVSAQPATVGTELVTLNQLNTSITSGSYTPTVTGTSNLSVANLKDASYIRSGNIITVTVGLGLQAVASNTITTVTITVPVNRAGSISNYYVGHGSYSFNNFFNPGHVVFSGSTTNLVTFSFNSGGSFGSGASGVVSFQYDITK